jgi:hypothetical protein
MKGKFGPRYARSHQPVAPGAGDETGLPPVTDCHGKNMRERMNDFWKSRGGDPMPNDFLARQSRRSKKRPPTIPEGGWDPPKSL